MIPQPYPLWFATASDRVGQVVAWTEVDGHEGLSPVVFWQGTSAANPVTEKGWLGETAVEARNAATPTTTTETTRPAAIPTSLDDLPRTTRKSTLAEEFEEGYVRAIERRSRRPK